MAIGPEDAAVPALADFVVGFAAMMAALALRGILYSWNGTFGFLLVGTDNKGGLAGLLDSKINLWVGSFRLGLGGPIVKLNDSVVQAIGGWASGFEAIAGRFFHAGAQLIRWMVKETEALSEDVYAWALHLQKVFLPTWLEGATHLVKGLAHTAEKVATRTETKVIHVTRVIRVEAKHAAAVTVPDVLIPELPAIDWLRNHWKQIREATLAGGAVAGGLIFPWHTVRDWYGWTKRNLLTHNKRLTRLEALFGAVGMATVMANALGLPNWRCITRGNLGRVSRALCGLSIGALEDVLGLLTDLFILENICDVIALLEGGLGLVSGPLTDWIDGADAMFVHCGYDLPGQLPEQPGLSLPPVTGVTLSLA